jgi:hypothetical protein
MKGQPLGKLVLVDMGSPLLDRRLLAVRGPDMSIASLTHQEGHLELEHPH